MPWEGGVPNGAVTGLPREDGLKRVLITGISGQDGSYLAELLLERGYRVHGMVRSESLADPDGCLSRIRGFLDRVVLHAGSLVRPEDVTRVVRSVRPEECYHLGAYTFAGSSEAHDGLVMETNIMGTLHVLGALREWSPRCRFFFAASSELFGNAVESPQKETTPFTPRNLYGISKTTGFLLTKFFREHRDLFACSGILYNHESPRRGFEFVTRKITAHAAQIKLGLKDKIVLGNVDHRRDWGHARDTVRGMVLLLNQDAPEDCILATGETHSVREFLETAFAHCGLDPYAYLKIDPKLSAYQEPVILCGDASRARVRLGWKPEIPFDVLVREMVDHDLHLFSSRVDGSGMQRGCEPRKDPMP